jgi:hypothetical protein
MGDDRLVELRIKLLEEQSRDHETRIRQLEAVAIKIGVWAFLGSVAGGSLVAALAGRMIGG